MRAGSLSQQTGLWDMPCETPLLNAPIAVCSGSSPRALNPTPLSQRSRMPWRARTPGPRAQPTAPRCAWWGALPGRRPQLGCPTWRRSVQAGPLHPRWGAGGCLPGAGRVLHRLLGWRIPRCVMHTSACMRAVGEPCVPAGHMTAPTSSQQQGPPEPGRCIRSRVGRAGQECSAACGWTAPLCRTPGRGCGRTWPGQRCWCAAAPWRCPSALRLHLPWVLTSGTWRLDPVWWGGGRGTPWLCFQQWSCSTNELSTA
jgi:hypothetical protein